MKIENWKKTNFRIFACATMWHETKSEMMEMMKSLFRMDEDQSARRVAQKYLKVVDADYYEFESKTKTFIYFTNLNRNAYSKFDFKLTYFLTMLLRLAMSLMTGCRYIKNPFFLKYVFLAKTRHSIEAT